MGHLPVSMPRFSKARRRKRAEAYVRVFGRPHASWLRLREAFGDQAVVSVGAHGMRLLLRLNTTDILVYSSVFEKEEYGMCLPFRPRVIFDIGAYTGLSTAYFAKRFPYAVIVALEPDSSNFDLLRLNTQAFPNVRLFNSALWHETGMMTLFDRGTGHWAFTLTPPETERSSRGVQIEAATIDELRASMDIDIVDILKIDVEGAEKEIFENSSSWIGRVRSIYAELHDRLRPGCRSAFEAATSSFELRQVSDMTVFGLNTALFEVGTSTSEG